VSVSVVVLEELSITALLGVRFWDVAAEAFAAEGLEVIAYPDAFPELRTSAVMGRSGVFSFHHLPGMGRIETGSGDDAFWAAHPPFTHFTVEVSDLLGRFLPFRFSVRVPVRGLFGLWASPLFPALAPDASWIPLFSAPSRPAPAASAMLRAQLQDTRTGLPAAFAMVTVQSPGLPLAVGLADERGMLSLPLPYPEPRNFAAGSPLRAGGIPLTDQSWPVQIAFFYSPRLGSGLPDLEDALHQGPATAWRDSARTMAASAFTLQYGTELILRSRDTVRGRDLSVLLITSAGSPL
jgi:hypothetical protein